MNYSEIIKKPVSNMTDEELEYLLQKARRLSDKIPGAMNLFDLPGTSYGYASLIEEEYVRREILSEGSINSKAGFALTGEIQKRRYEIHRNDPPYHVYQKVLINRVEATNTNFTKEELEHMIWFFENSNDPLGTTIAEKARLQIERMN